MSLPPPRSKCLIKQLRLSPLTPSTVEVHNGPHKVLSWEYIQHSAFNRGSPGDFSWWKKVPVWRDNLASFFFFFPELLCANRCPPAQTGRKISKQRKQRRGITQGPGRKGNSSEDDQEMIRAMFNKTIPWASVCHIYYLFFLPPLPRSVQ